MICKRAQWSAEAESGMQEEGNKWVGTPAGNSGSYGDGSKCTHSESRTERIPHCRSCDKCHQSTPTLAFLQDECSVSLDPLS